MQNKIICGYCGQRMKKGQLSVHTRRYHNGRRSQVAMSEGEGEGEIERSPIRDRNFESLNFTRQTKEAHPTSVTTIAVRDYEEVCKIEVNQIKSAWLRATKTILGQVASLAAWYGWSILKWLLLSFIIVVGATVSWAYAKTTYIYEKLCSMYNWVKEKFFEAKDFMLDILDVNEFSVGNVMSIIQKNKDYYRQKFTEKIDYLHNKINEIASRLEEPFSPGSYNFRSREHIINFWTEKVMNGTEISSHADFIYGNFTTVVGLCLDKINVSAAQGLIEQWESIENIVATCKLYQGLG